MFTIPSYFMLNNTNFDLDKHYSFEKSKLLSPHDTPYVVRKNIKNLKIWSLSIEK